jgi:hypothetical protein
MKVPSVGAGPNLGVGRFRAPAGKVGRWTRCYGLPPVDSGIHWAVIEPPAGPPRAFPTFGIAAPWVASCLDLKRPLLFKVLCVFLDGKRMSSLSLTATDPVQEIESRAIRKTDGENTGVFSFCSWSFF